MIEIEDPTEGLERLFPDQEIVNQFVIYPRDEFDIWQPIVKEIHYKVGFKMVKILFYNGKESEALKYILPYKREIKKWFRLLLERKISRNTFEEAIMKVEKKFVLWEAPIKRNIDKKDNVEEYQKKGVKLLLEFGVDQTIKEITNGSGKHKSRTKILESVFGTRNFSKKKNKLKGDMEKYTKTFYKRL